MIKHTNRVCQRRREVLNTRLFRMTKPSRNSEIMKKITALKHMAIQVIIYGKWNQTDTRDPRSAQLTNVNCNRFGLWIWSLWPKLSVFVYLYEWLVPHTAKFSLTRSFRTLIHHGFTTLCDQLDRHWSVWFYIDLFALFPLTQKFASVTLKAHLCSAIWLWISMLKNWVAPLRCHLCRFVAGPCIGPGWFLRNSTLR